MKVYKCETLKFILTFNIQWKQRNTVINSVEILHIALRKSLTGVRFQARQFLHGNEQFVNMI
jgi:hypothetical protein